MPTPKQVPERSDLPDDAGTENSQDPRIAQLESTLAVLLDFQGISATIDKGFARIFDQLKPLRDLTPPRTGIPLTRERSEAMRYLFDSLARPDHVSYETNQIQFHPTYFHSTDTAREATSSDGMPSAQKGA